MIGAKTNQAHRQWFSQPPCWHFVITFPFYLYVFLSCRKPSVSFLGYLSYSCNIANTSFSFSFSFSFHTVKHSQLHFRFLFPFVYMYFDKLHFIHYRTLNLWQRSLPPLAHKQRLSAVRSRDHARTHFLQKITAIVWEELIYFLLKYSRSGLSDAFMTVRLISPSQQYPFGLLFTYHISHVYLFISPLSRIQHTGWE